MAFSFDIKGMLTGVLLPILLGEGEKALGSWLDELATKEPDWHKTILIITHRLLTAHGAEVVANTSNTYDDLAVASLIKALEANAAKHGISLAV